MLTLINGLWLGALAAMLVVTAWHDAAAQRIPNWAVLSGSVIALGLSVPPGGIGFGSAVAGLATGFAVLLPFYLMRVMGAGDVKLLAAVGAFVGFPGVLSLVLFTFLAGGVISLAWAIRLRRVRSLFMNLRAELYSGMVSLAGGNLLRAGDFPVSAIRVPYAFAIAIGTAAYLLLSNRFS